MAKLLRLILLVGCLMAASWTVPVSAAGLPWSMLIENGGIGSNSSVVYGGSIYTYESASGKVWSSTSGSDWWMSGGSPGSLSGSGQLLTFNSKIWCFNSGIHTSTNGQGWFSDAPTPWAYANYFRVAELGGKLWCFQFDGSTWTSSNGVQWQKALGTAPWGGRDDFALINFGGNLLLLGGRNHADARVYYNDVWSTADGLKWTKIQANAAWSPRSGAAVTIYANKLWLLGGAVQAVADANDVWSSTDGINWYKDKGKSTWAPRHGHSAVVKDNVIYVIGGLVWGWDARGALTTQVAAGTVYATLDSKHDAVAASSLAVNVERSANAQFSLSVVNTGATAWTHAGGYGLKLAGQKPATLWRAPEQIITLPAGVTVNPGQTYTFTVPVNTQGLLGKAALRAQMYAPGVLFFGDLFDMTVIPVPMQGLVWRQVTPQTGLDTSHLNHVVAFNGRLWADNQWTTDGLTWRTAVAYNKAPWNDRIGPILGVYKDKLWLMGGFNTNSEYVLGDVWSSEDGVTWVKATDAAPWKDYYYWGNGRPVQAFVYKGKLVVKQGNYNLNSTSDGITWQNHYTDYNLYDGMVTVFNNALWRLGSQGYDYYDYSNYASEVKRATDFGSSNWIDMANLPEVRFNHVSLTYHDLLWVIGGRNTASYNGPNYENTVWCSVDGNNWQYSTPLPFAEGGGYIRLEGVVYNDKIWLFVWRYNTVEIWTGTPAEDLAPSKRLLDLGDQDIFAGLSPAQSVTFYNRTPDPLWLRGAGIEIIGSEAAHFKVVSGATTMIPVHGNMTLQVAFDPDRVGLTTATLRVSYTAPYSPVQEVALRGDGTTLGHDGQYMNILDYLLGFTSNRTGLDINADGRVTVADLLGQKSQAIRVTSPASGAQWKMASMQTIRWAVSSAAGSKVHLKLYRNHKFYQTIADNVSNTGSYDWEVPYGVVPTGDYTIAVLSASNAAAAGESGSFMSLLPVSNDLTILSPNGGERWTFGSTREIRWKPGALGQWVRLSIYKGGNYLRMITDQTLNDGSYTWEVPSDLEAGNDYQITISWGPDRNKRDMSDNPLTLVAP